MTHSANAQKLLCSVADSIERGCLLPHGARVLIAVSGGPDSCCLLDVLCRLRAEHGYTPAIAHVNYTLRGDASDADERFVRALADRYAVPVFVHRVLTRRIARERRRSLEETARDIRYDFFLRICRQHNYAAVALAHHADDQAETVLMRLVRGSGISGLSAMRPVTGRDNVRIVRPLLEIGRDQIISYLRRQRLAWRVDASNADQSISRNRFRYTVLPLLRAENPRVDAALARSAAHAAQVQDYLQRQIGRAFRRIARLLPGEALMDCRKLQRLDPALHSGVLRAGLEYVAGSLRRFETRHVRLLEELAAGCRRSIDLPRGVAVSRTEEGLLHFRRAGAASGTSEPSPSDGSLSEGSVCRWNGRLYSVRVVRRRSVASNTDPQVEYVDAARVRFPLKIRTRRPGDRFMPLGMQEYKSLKEFLIDAKVPLRQRDSLAIVLSGRRIVWVAGVRIAQWCRLTEKTRTVLELRMK